MKPLNCLIGLHTWEAWKEMTKQDMSFFDPGGWCWPEPSNLKEVGGCECCDKMEWR